MQIYWQLKPMDSIFDSTYHFLQKADGYFYPDFLCQLLESMGSPDRLLRLNKREQIGEMRTKMIA